MAHIAKADLKPGAYYLGHCRNTGIALWQGSYFIYIRRKFGEHFLETIKHPEDDDGYDLFYPRVEVNIDG